MLPEAARKKWRRQSVGGSKQSNNTHSTTTTTPNKNKNNNNKNNKNNNNDDKDDTIADNCNPHLSSSPSPSSSPSTSPTTIMGAAASVTVINTTAIKEDYEALLAIFPDRFQVETQPDTEIISLVENEMTLILVPTTNNNNNSYGKDRTIQNSTVVSLTLEQDEILQQATARAVIYGMQVEERQIMERLVAKIVLPSGTRMLVAPVMIWNNSLARSTLLSELLIETATPKQKTRKKSLTFSPLKKKRSSMSSSLSRSQRLQSLNHSVSMPNIASLVDQSEEENTSVAANTTTAVTSPSSQRYPPNAKFPYLKTQCLATNNTFVPFELNSQEPVPIETDLFVGKVFMVMRPNDPTTDPFWNDKIFSKKKRRFIMQIQGKFKVKPKGELYAGGEVSEPMKLGLLATGISSFLLKLLRRSFPAMHYSFGDDTERAHIVFPASTFFEHIIITPPNETPPVMGEDFKGDPKVTKARRENKLKIDWNTTDTYSMSFHSMYVDYASWKVVNIPASKDLDLHTFWGNAFSSMVLYEQFGSDDKHETNKNKYAMCLQMEFLGDTAGQGVPESEGLTEDRFIETESVASSSQGIHSIASSSPDAAAAAISDDSDNEDDYEEEEDEEFFDTVEQQTLLYNESETEHDYNLAITKTYSDVLRVIDRCCPIYIEMIAKRGKYVPVYAFPKREGGMQFRTFEICSNYLGDRNITTDYNQQFSQRLSSTEETRRFLGLRLAEARIGKADRTKLSQFERLRTLYDKKFLCRPAPPGYYNVTTVNNKKRTSGTSSITTNGCIKASFVARALSDRHWIEEWATITSKYDICFKHPDKSKPALRIGLSSIVNVGPLPPNECPLFTTSDNNISDNNYYFMTIETFGRCIYVMFSSEQVRDDWVQTILGKMPQRQQPQTIILNNDSNNNNATPTAAPIPTACPDNSETVRPHYMEIDNPMEEFLHKSSMWDCKQRRIMNCRRFSFQTKSTEERPNPMTLVEMALRKGTSLRSNNNTTTSTAGMEDSQLRDFLDCTAQLKDASVHELITNSTEHVAFFINLYHVMIIHAFLVLGPPNSSFQWISYFNTIAYQCSDDVFSLTELEHNIIRAKMSYPSQFLSRFILPKSEYGIALSQSDYRINFALNCGSASIPSVAVPIYKGDTLHDQLDVVSREFLDATVSVTKRSSGDVVVTLPRVVQWFSDDFGDTPCEIVKRLFPLLGSTKQEILQSFWSGKSDRYINAYLNVKYLPFSFECRSLILST